MARQAAEAEGRGEVLRYVGAIDVEGKACSVSLRVSFEYQGGSSPVVGEGFLQETLPGKMNEQLFYCTARCSGMRTSGGLCRFNKGFSGV